MKRTAAVLPVLLLAACGGGGASAEKTAYLAKAEAVCAKANAEFKAVPGLSKAADLAPYVRRLVDIASRTTTALAAVTPPKADAADLKAKVIGPLQEQVLAGRRFADDVDAATNSGDEAALGRLAGNAPTKPRADLAFMRSYGFKACVDAADTSN